MPRIYKSKLDYSLRYRVKIKNGQWGEWRIAYSQWMGITTVQNQIKILARAYPRDIEVEFEKDKKLLNWEGKEIGKSMIFEKR